MLGCSARRLTLAAALVWHVGAGVLLVKGVVLLFQGERLDPGLGWPWLVVPAAALIGLLKARLLMIPAARANIVRIRALAQPRLWNVYRPGFLLFLGANVLLARWLISRSTGHYAGTLLCATMALSIGLALLGSSFVWWSHPAAAKPGEGEL